MVSFSGLNVLADFEKAFAKLGCRTRFIIEENDVQALMPAFYWRELDEFKPDAVFMISHARPSMSYLPPELPFISYVQDKCGPLLTLPDLAGHVTEKDLFICLSREHRRFLTAKNVPAENTFIMPVPVDELLFHPLPEDHLKASEYTVDASFVKHGTPHAEEAFARFLKRSFGALRDERTKRTLTDLFRELYRATCEDPSRCRYEDEMHAFVEEKLSGAMDESVRHFLRQCVSSFHCEVYSPAWRYRFLEALDEAGVELALYGKNWSENKKLFHLDRGPVDRERELNYVYNFTRINLSINHMLSMTHRLVECALAGGFMLVAYHPPEKDCEPAGDYFEPGKELIFFDSPADLIEKCRYYLAHEEERRRIAEALRSRALHEHTSVAGARTVLEKWRELLRRRTSSA